ncbi:MAG: hypothetical protein A4S09_14590 [Proteobacteria bacterium SG_bin7]|nr:MAG: hypothetical protein A4S09_14590 [Proteobacteria bacterium SG_bin7]
MEINNEIFNQIVEFTGLPKEEIAGELTYILSSYGLNPATVTMEQLRDAMTNYLQDVLLEVKNQISGAVDSNS